jgi:hypothetical protein
LTTVIIMNRNLTGEEIGMAVGVAEHPPILMPDGATGLPAGGVTPASRNARPAPQPRKQAELGSLAVTAEELAEMLRVSLRHVRRQEASGKLPPPVRIGRSLRYRVTGPFGVRAWLDAGCPDRTTFERCQSTALRNQGASMN